MSKNKNSANNSFWGPGGDYVNLPDYDIHKDCNQCPDCPNVKKIRKVLGWGNSSILVDRLGAQKAFWQCKNLSITQKQGLPNLCPKCHTPNDKLVKFHVPREANYYEFFKK